MTQQNNSQILSYKSILRVIFVLLVLAFLYTIRDVVALIFVSLITAAALDPFVDYFQKHKIPRALSILVIYLIVFAIFSVVVAMLVPPISEQVGQLAKNLPDYYNRVMVGFADETHQSSDTSLPEALTSLSSNLAETTRGVFSTLTGIFGGIIALISVLVIVFYLVVEEKGLKHFIHLIVPNKFQEYVTKLVDRIQEAMGLWLRGQLTLMLVVGLMTYFGLTIMGVKYALLLALFAGLTEIIPFVGPIVGSIPAIFIAFSDSLFKTLLVVILYIIVQQLENHILVPRVMEKATGLNPVVVIVAILIGGKLGGVIGALLAVPVAVMINIFINEFVPHKYFSKATKI
ncbi:MAG: AI-2E family transporter [Patescibacteria group bacterium]